MENKDSNINSEIVREDKPIREALVNTAVQFLQNPNIASSPDNLKQGFLKKKGLTDEEISLAISRAGVKLSSEVIPNYRSYNGQVSIPVGNYHPYQQQIQQYSKLQWLRDLANAIIVFGGLGYGLYYLYKRYIEPFLFGFGKRGRKKSVETQIGELDQNIRLVKNETIESIERLGKNIDQQVEMKMEIVCQRYLQNVQDLTSQISSLKGLLLNRKQFPATPAVAPPSIPSWQLPGSPATEAVNSMEDSKDNSLASDGNSTNGNMTNGSDDSSLEMIKDEKMNDV